MISNNDFYLYKIIEKYKLPSIPDFNTFWHVEFPLRKEIEKWSNLNFLPLCQIKRSGSRAKGTAVSLSSDLDLFISLSSTTTPSLKNVYDSLFDYFDLRGYYPRRQNVSIGVNVCGNKVDLVPAVRQGQFGNDHSLYKSKQKTWTKTNIDTHISTVKTSARIYEIMALKIWRELHGIDFPSIYLELFTMKALKGRKIDDWSTNFYYLLWFLYQNIERSCIIDPANMNNRISDDLTQAEKKKIANQACIDFAKPLSQIIW